MIEAILIGIGVLLFLIYRQVNQLLKESAPKTETGKYSTNQLLEQIRDWLHEIEKNSQFVSDHFSKEHPVGVNSDKYKKMQSLIDIYTKHLIKTEKLTEKDAKIRARFEYHRFGEDKVLSEVDGWKSIYYEEKDEAEKDYYQSDILNKAIDKYSDYQDGFPKKVTPFYLAEPMYDIIIKRIQGDYFSKDNYEKTHEIVLDRYESYDSSYYQFVKNRVIIYHLEKMGIIKKTNDKGWGEDQRWTIPDTNWSRVKSKIYAGESSHEDSYFEEKYNEGDLNSLFSVAYS